MDAAAPFADAFEAPHEEPPPSSPAEAPAPAPEPQGPEFITPKITPVASLSDLWPPATYEEAQHYGRIKRPEDCRIPLCRVHGKAPANKPRELLPADRRLLETQGAIQVGKDRILVNPAPYEPWLASTCEHCFQGRRGEHKHRLDTACIYCGARNVWPRGPHGAQVPELICHTCGRWWDPSDPRAKDAPNPFGVP